MKTVIEIAKQVYGDHVEFNEAQTQRLQEIEALIRADEREACANDWEAKHGYDKHGVAATIRARGNT